MPDEIRRRRRILDARTRELARGGRSAPAAPRGTAQLLVETGGTVFGVPLAATRGVTPAGAVAPLPGTHPAVVGIAHQAGRFVGVIDLSAALALPAAERAGFLVLLRSEPPVALAVEAVRGTATPEAVAEAGRAVGDGARAGGSAGGAVAGHARLDGPAGGAVTLLDLPALTAPLFPLPLAFPKGVTS
ncbi:chemotaxis protein CheW [Chthonobacter rhizosphaerae]|uniref:chemotaxis protein CheW n=1 Tax=Chthonobacter rhizosphaerae TaxID=2735553 RepID=UPI0015EF5B5F|nr:chemotaxis protein CheW [Chthonobacter rhizosphaerae]